MGQKVNPIGIRLGFIRKSNAFWYPYNDTFANTLKNDLTIRSYLRNNLSKKAGISTILIERINQNIKIIINAAKPGLIIGKRGEDIEKLRLKLNKLYDNISININVEEIKKPELDAFLIAENVALQLKKRVVFRRAMKRVVTNAMKQGAKGIKVAISGRINGADIARKEWCKEGRIPLHTFKADIDYGFAESHTVYGLIGVKVWVYKGDVVFKKIKNITKD
ncbi:MAG: 30S ribosomal protein S3 [Candidatus Riesia sp.]|nr:30S ribosomal protein S3 [Candidatus Riesia sp.]